MTNQYGNELLHKVLLDAMKDIDKICRENGLKYYLHAGTLLGAFNHQGFIPWDDDVDVSMLRSDYERFIDVVKKEYSPKYYIQNLYSDHDYSNNRAVLRILGTKLIHNHESTGKHCEIGLDIVPLDAAPDYKILRIIQEKLIWIFDTAVQIKQGEIIPQNPIIRLIGILSRLDRVKLGRIIDKLAMMFNRFNTKQIGLLTYTGKNPYTGKSGYENDLMQRSWYEHPIMVPFEDTEFMTISEPTADLVHRYGPHWHDPYPEEKRITKHDIKTYEISPEVMERIK